MSYGKISITENAGLIISANPQRQSLILVNTSGSGTCYIGADSSVTTANGTAIEGGGTLTEDSGGTRMYMGDVYGICATCNGTVDLRYWERTR